jgi:hypothetical protein
MTDIPTDIEQEFNRWCSEEHVRDMQKVPGVLNVRRYRVVDGQPKYLLMADLENPGVVETPEYQSISSWNPKANPLSISMSTKYFNTIRGVYQLLLALPSPEPTDLSAARGLLLRGLSTKPEHEKALDEWYNAEHLPNLAGVPGVLRARRYKLAAGATNLKGNPPGLMAVYELERRQVLETPTFQRAVETPWTNQVRPFFCDPSLRNVYERVFPA